MQEEVEQRSLTLVINSGKMTGRVLKSAIVKLMAHNRQKAQGKGGDVRYAGKQTLRQLVGQNQGVSNVELNDADIRDFKKTLRQYGVDYAVKKVDGQDKFLVFFKARDADAINAALTDYASQKVQRSQRPSLLKRLREIAVQLPALNADRDRHRHQEQSR